MIIPMLCVTIFVILVVWFLLPRVARLMIHTPTAISKIGRAVQQECRDRDRYSFPTRRSSDLYDNPNALRDYFRDIGRMVLAAEGRKANDSHADCYQYFCVPEYGTANG